MIGGTTMIWNKAGHHISGIEIKTAEVLSTVQLWDDYYHNNIVTAAMMLCKRGAGAMEYLTQYGSGNSCWRNPMTDKRIIINISKNSGGIHQ